MRILLIQPPYQTHVVNPPLGMGYLASYVKREGHRVELLDLNLLHRKPEWVAAFLHDARPDLVGVSVMCTGIDVVKRLIRLVKETIGAPVVVGGSQVSALPSHSLRYTGADFAVVGEGEITFAELLSELEGGGRFEGVEGLAYFSDGEVRVNERRPLIEDIDSLPQPDWDLMPPKKYRIAPILSSAKKYPIAPLVTSRGCPFDCTFCAGKTIWGRTYRYRSAVAVVDEIEMLMKDFGVREIFISDDNFNLKPSHAVDVCEEIRKRRLKIHWACPNGLRVDSLTPEFLALMKEAGCHLIGLGIESGSQEILDRAKKSLDLSIVPRVCGDITDAGITAVGFFVLGLPGETTQTLEKTIDFAKSLPLKRAWFNILAPYPGSEIFEAFSENKDLDGIAWRCLDTSGKEVAQMSEVSPRELDIYQKKAAKTFYSQPRVLWDLVISQRPATIAAFIRSQFFQNILGRRGGAGSFC